jgi:hypothetical protein
MGTRGKFYVIAAVVLVAIVWLYRKSMAQSQAAAAAKAGGLVGSLNTVYKTTDSVLGNNFGVAGRVGATILTHPIENYTDGNWNAAAWSAATAGWSDVYDAIW